MERIEGKRILVTGSTGQVAGELTESLAERNTVFAAARFTDARARAALEAKGIATVPFSLGDADLSGLPDVDYVFHCGCNTRPRSPEEGLAINAEGTGFLMQRYRGARAFFHMSSSSVYRVASNAPRPTQETDMLGGLAAYASDYSMSKLAAEAIVRFQARALALPTVIARLDVAYGRRGHGGVPMLLFDLMQQGVAYTRAAAGDSFCTPIHEDDIARLAEQLILKADVPAPIVNLGGDDVVRVEELLAHMEALTGRTMKRAVAEQSTWGTIPLDPTLRRSLVGPCRVPWKEGMRRALAARHPGAIVESAAR